MSDFEKLINASDLIEWIMETYPDWCVGDVRSIVDHIESLPSAQPEYYDYSDIDDIWEYYAKEQDIKLTDSAKQLKDAMWVGYRKGKQDAQRWIPCSEKLPEGEEDFLVTDGESMAVGYYRQDAKAWDSVDFGFKK